jgi:GxxExxY protein
MNTKIGHRVTETQRKNEVTEIHDVRSDPLTERIIGCAIEVHRRIGPGLLESMYEAAMAIEPEVAGIKFQRQVPVSIEYRGRIIGEHRLDLVVETAVVVELKSVERFDPIFQAQLLTYLKLTGLKVGLLINFNSGLFRDGIRRFVL